MSINAKILDSRTDGDSICYLTKFSLLEYLSSLPENYQEYDIQREIVSTNVYLDKIIDTVLNKYHIPTIVLVMNSAKDNLDEGVLNVNSEDYKILDGLQRTHRLKTIFDTYSLFKDELNQEGMPILSLKKYALSRRYASQLSKIKSNYNILFKIIEFYKNNDKDIRELEKVFKDNFLWFEVWTNISEDKQIEKMLLLNAGHKPVKLKHQLELLFINNLLKEFKNKPTIKDFKLIREKDVNSSSFSKSRNYGEFHFSQLIASIIAFDKGKLIVTSANLISSVQDNDFTIQELNNELSYDFLNDFIEFLMDFDMVIRDYYPGNIKWFGRETSLVGLFAALGGYRSDNEVYVPKEIFKKLIDYLKDNPKVLNVDNYDSGRKILDLSKINYGNINRKVVYNAFKDLIDEIYSPKLFNITPIDWEKYFSKFA